MACRAGCFVLVFGILDKLLKLIDHLVLFLLARSFSQQFWVFHLDRIYPSLEDTDVLYWSLALHDNVGPKDVSLLFTVTYQDDEAAWIVFLIGFEEVQVHLDNSPVTVTHCSLRWCLVCLLCASVHLLELLSLLLLDEPRHYLLVHIE